MILSSTSKKSFTMLVESATTPYVPIISDDDCSTNLVKIVNRTLIVIKMYIKETSPSVLTNC